MEQAGVTAVPASQVEQGGAGGRQVDSGQNNGNNIMYYTALTQSIPDTAQYLHPSTTRFTLA